MINVKTTKIFTNKKIAVHTCMYTYIHMYTYKILTCVRSLSLLAVILKCLESFQQHYLAIQSPSTEKNKEIVECTKKRIYFKKYIAELAFKSYQGLQTEFHLLSLESLCESVIIIYVLSKLFSNFFDFIHTCSELQYQT